MFYKFLSSFYVAMCLFFILALGAAVATFVENDFGTQVARVTVYNALWYEIILSLSALNILFVLHKTKLYRHFPRFIFHLSFVVILIGAGLTRYLGVEGVMKIREGSVSQVIFSTDKNKEITLPFALKLVDFELTRYYGSKSPSEYKSLVTVLDEKNDKSFDFTIFMNHTLVYKGYKFFQTFYDPDEKGTILSVSYDPGVEVTYGGYALLFLGLILNFFDSKSRLRRLIAKVKNSTLSLLILVMVMGQMPLFSSSEYIDTYMLEHQKNSQELSDAFGKLVVQSRMGRMKPFDTLSHEILYKISGKSALYGMDATQIMLGMFSHPKLWKKVDLIKVKTPKLKALIGIDEHQNLASFEDFFKGGKYKLEALVEEALAMKPSQRGTFENDIIKVDERLSISFMVYYGSLFKLFPFVEDKNNTWLGFPDMWEKLHGEEGDALRESGQKFADNLFARDYAKALLHVKHFEAYQEKYGQAIMPSKSAISYEILLNKAMIFERLTLAYVGFGMLLLVIAFGRIFSQKFFTCKLDKPLFYLVSLLFLIHTFGLGARWIVSGHAPFSDTYESIVYIAWSCLLFSVLFLRKSLFALAGSVMMAGIFMFVAHLGHIDPEITNLVPVLKSFWLSIHVSIITASYGFLALGCALGFITLILFMSRNASRPAIDLHIKQLTDINEITLIIGLSFLVIGNFLGGIWANESWGRYWGWDPKETWAYISIIIYAMVLHVRLIAKWYSPYLFAVLSLVSFASILMTYFGVNFYLAGMHSYATGDPVPIPLWVYVCSGVVLSLIVLSYPKKNLKEKNEEN